MRELKDERGYYKKNIRRQRGRVVRAPALKSGGTGFKSRSER